MSDTTTILIRYPERMPIRLAEHLVSQYNETTVYELRNAVPYFYASETVDSEAFCGFYSQVKRREAMRV